MTVATTINRWEYTGDAVTVNFAYTNRIFATSDLKVYLDNVLQVAGYTVSGVDDPAGGSVTFTAAPGVGVLVVIDRRVPETQPLIFVNDVAVDAVLFAAGLDRTTILVQQIAADLARSLVLDPSDSAAPDMTLPLVAALKGNYIIFDLTTGQPVVAGPPAGTTTVSIFGATLIVAADAAAARAILEAHGIEADGGVIFEDTDDGALTGPVVDLYRNPAIPLAGDQLGSLIFSGESDAGNKRTYFRIRCILSDPTDMSEDGRLDFVQITGGSPLTACYMVAGFNVGNPFSGDQGRGQINVETAYNINGENVMTGVLGIRGLHISNDITDADHDMLIKAGGCHDEAGTQIMVLAADTIKQIDAAWVVGTNQGGLDTGTATANTFYSIWVIERSDTKVVDVIFSKNHAISPLFPTNYDTARRIGTLRTDASANILAWKWTTGPGEIDQTVMFAARVLDLDDNSPSAGDARDVPLSLPFGEKWLAELAWLVVEAGTSWNILQDPDLPHTTPSSTNFDTTTLTGETNAALKSWWRLDNQAKIHHESDVSNLSRVVLQSLGFVDKRRGLKSGATSQYCGTAVTDGTVGTVAWSSVVNAQGVPDSADTTAVGTAAENSEYLKCTNFGFNIPASATIRGIWVRFTCTETTPAITGFQNRIVKAGVIGSDAGNDADGAWDSGADLIRELGGPADLWGDSWTPAEVNAATFGVALSVSFASVSDEAAIDAVEMIVYYD